MPDILVYVSIPHRSGLARDAAVNTFAFQNVSGAPFGLADLLESFYTEPTTTTSNSVGQFIGGQMDRSTPIHAKVYEITTGPLGLPSAEFDVGALPAPLGDPLPAEVALCASYSGLVDSTANRDNRRGRIYIGPLSDAAVDGSLGTTDVARPNSTVMTTLVEASQRLALDSTTEGAPWSVYSRTLNQLTAIERGWVDNEWDTQRRRGYKATARTSWSLSV